MPISDSCRVALEASKALDPWVQNPVTDRLTFRAALESGAVPDDAPASAEFRWIAVNLVLNNRSIPYETAPSKSAAAWIRRMRWKSGKALKERFWEESWPFYMDSRLSLELKSEAPARRKGGGVVLPVSSSRMKNDGTISALLKDGKKAEDSANGNGAGS